ncbi:MAG: hypothetical protein FWE40_06500 [Oscillospiraceae bacterium]|nr:hypothetical protein [Oscillospiraceae bacterium]
MLNYLGNWASILGLIITVLTLLMMLNIRGKIDRSLGKQRFLQQREGLLAELTEIRTCVRENADCDLDEHLLHLRELLLQLVNYRIWRIGDRLKLRQIISSLTKTYNGQKRTGRKAYVMYIDEVIAMVKAQAEV